MSQVLASHLSPTDTISPSTLPESVTSASKTKPTSFLTIPHSVWILGIMMFFINVSVTMVYGVSGIYLKSLGVAMAWIGFVEGFAEGLSFATKLLSGVFSDYLRRRKSIMILGYLMTLASRPILAMYANFGAAFSGRLLERLGNGVQATPRDALMSDIAPHGRKGECFGLMRSFGVFGSLVGGGIGMVVMLLTIDNFQHVFWWAAIPAALAFLLLLFAVAEPEELVHPADHQKRHPIHWSDLPRLGKPYWMLMVVVGLFMLARVGETFLVFHGHQNFGFSTSYAPSIVMLYNLTYALSSYPVGKLADRLNRYNLLALAVAVLVIADIILASATTLTGFLLGVVVWGTQMGMAQSVFMALIAEMAPKDLRGTAFGFFYLISAVAMVVAGTTAGTIAHLYGESMMFLGSGIVASFALLTLYIFRPKRDHEPVV